METRSCGFCKWFNLTNLSCNHVEGPERWGYNCPRFEYKFEKQLRSQEEVISDRK